MGLEFTEINQKFCGILDDRWPYNIKNILSIGFLFHNFGLRNLVSESKHSSSVLYSF